MRQRALSKCYAHSLGQPFSQVRGFLARCLEGGVRRRAGYENSHVILYPL